MSHFGGNAPTPITAAQLGVEVPSNMELHSMSLTALVGTAMGLVSRYYLGNAPPHVGDDIERIMREAHRRDAIEVCKC